MLRAQLNCIVSGFAEKSEAGIISHLSLFFCFDSFVYQCRGYACGETVIDVDDGDTCGTTIKHCQKGGDAAEAGSCADAGGDGNYGTTDEASYNAGQSPFHSRDNDDDVGLLEFRQMAEEPMQAGYADVANQLCALPHNVGGDFGFCCDG